MLFFATSEYIKCIKTSFKRCPKCSCKVCPKSRKRLSCFCLGSGAVLSPSVAVIADPGGGCVLFGILKLWGALLNPLADHIDLALNFSVWSTGRSNLDFKELVRFVRRTVILTFERRFSMRFWTYCQDPNQPDLALLAAAGSLGLRTGFAQLLLWNLLIISA